MKNLLLVLGLSLISYASVSFGAEAEKEFKPRNVAQAVNGLSVTLKKIDADATKCMENPKNQNTTGSMQCGFAKNEACDKELNKLYKATLAKVSDEYAKETGQKLKKAQQAWIPYRNANCSLHNTGGSLGRVEESWCNAEMTCKRTAELNDILSNY